MRLVLTVLTTALLGITAAAQQPASPALTPRMLESLLAARPQGADAEQLAARVRTMFGAEAIARGAAPQVDELQVAWALEVPQPQSARVVRVARVPRAVRMAGAGRPVRHVHRAWPATAAAST